MALLWDYCLWCWSLMAFVTPIKHLKEDYEKFTQGSEDIPVGKLWFHVKGHNGGRWQQSLAYQNKSAIGCRVLPWAATIEYIMINRRNSDLRGILTKIAPNIRLFYLEEQNQFVLSYVYIH